MSPDNILRSDVLDIVFENRNKDYGAYALRKYYYRRLRVALIAVSVMTVILSVMNQMKQRPIKSSTLMLIVPLFGVSAALSCPPLLHAKNKTVGITISKNLILIITLYSSV